MTQHSDAGEAWICNPSVSIKHSTTEPPLPPPPPPEKKILGRKEKKLTRATSSTELQIFMTQMIKISAIIWD